MSAPVLPPLRPDPTVPEPERPAALRRKPQILAVVAIVISALVPLAVAYGVPVCSVLDAVGVHLEACGGAPELEPELLPPAPQPPGGVLLHRHRRDGGAQ